jgi:hypothetical protein
MAVVATGKGITLMAVVATGLPHPILPLPKAYDVIIAPREVSRLMM